MEPTLRRAHEPINDALAHATAIPVIASGGVAGIEDIDALMVARSGIVEGGIEGVITGRALYDGRLDLAQALKVARG